jgi:hypothetical protein
MATKIKDSATAEKAALNLNTGIEVPAPAEPNAPREKGTTERLFPDFMTPDGGIVNRPVPKDVPATETVEAVAPTQTPPVQPPTAPAYIKPEDLTGKMARIKVDGVEQDVPASELFKLTQLERHSNAQLMKLAQERAQLERERQEFMARPTEQTKPTKQEPPVKKSQEVEALEARLAQMEQSMVQERALLMPQIQEAGIKRVEQMAKDRLGTDDFRSYFDKIRDNAMAEVAKPENANNPQARAFFDSDAYYFQKYQEMKLRDLVSKPAAPVPTNPTAPVLQTQQGAPVLVNNSGQPVSIPTFESSSGVPSTPSEQGNWQSTYNALLARAKADPTDLNWMNVMRHKFRENQ